MGCAGTKAVQKNGDSQKPRPQVFAIMRNGHEVIRGCSRDLKELVDLGSVEEFQKYWNQSKAWMSYHAKMEDGVEGKGKGMFALLDEKFDGIATKNKLQDAHHELHDAEANLLTAMGSGEVERLRVAFEQFNKINLAHLEEEEKVMMPCIQKMAKAGDPLVAYLQNEIVSTAWDETGFGEEFITFGLKTLEKHHEGKPRARVWVHAIQAIASDAQWKTWLPFVKAGLSEKLFTEIDDLIKLSG